MSWDSAESVAGEAPPGSPVLGFMHLQPQRPGVPAPSCGSRATALTCGFPVLSAGVMKCHTEREDGGWARAGKDGRAHGLSSGSAPEPVLSGPYAGASSQAGRDRGLSKSDAGRRREAGREQSRCASPRGAVRISASGRPPPGADRDGTSMSHAVSLSCTVFATRRLGTSRTHFPWDEAQTRRYEPRHKRGAVPAAEQGWADPQAASSVLDAVVGTGTPAPSPARGPPQARGQCSPTQSEHHRAEPLADGVTGDRKMSTQRNPHLHRSQPFKTHLSFLNPPGPKVPQKWNHICIYAGLDLWIN